MLVSGVLFQYYLYYSLVIAVLPSSFPRPEESGVQCRGTVGTTQNEYRVSAREMQELE
jgi:hypothetical protein